jgi:hypothetical protein
MVNCLAINAQILNLFHALLQAGAPQAALCVQREAASCACVVGHSANSLLYSAISHVLHLLAAAGQSSLSSALCAA